MLSVFFDHLTEAAEQEGLSPEEMCAYAKRLGYDGVHMNFASVTEENLALLKDAGLKVCSIFSFEDLSGGDTEENRARAREVIGRCRRAGCRMLMLLPGFLNEKTERGSAGYERLRQNMAAALRAAVPLAEKEGVTLLLEDFDGDRAPFCYSEELMWFLREVPGLRCAFDTGNFAYADEDSGELLERFLPYISDVHCKDRAFSPASGSPMLSVGGRALYPCAVGDGDLPVAGIVRRLLECGYTGCFAAEHYGSARQKEDIARSYAALRGMMRE